MVFQVLGDRLLTFFPGVVQGAGTIFSAGSLLYSAAGYLKGIFSGFDSLQEGCFLRWTGQTGTAAALLLAIDQAGFRELGKDAGEQATQDSGRDARLVAMAEMEPVRELLEEVSDV